MNELYVKEMPEYCAECPFYEQSFRFGDGCYATKSKIDITLIMKKRADNCPLRPLSEAAKECEYVKTKSDFDGHFHFDCSICDDGYVSQNENSELLGGAL
jgi:hypothetical protein